MEGKGKHERSKSRPELRDLKKKQCAFCKEIGCWKVDYLRIKDKNKNESKTEANRYSVLKPILHRQMDQTQTHRYSLYPLLLLLLATQETLSAC